MAEKTGEVPYCILTTAKFSANDNNKINLSNCAASIGGTLSATNQSGIVISGIGTTAVFNCNSPNSYGTCSPVPVSVQDPVPNLPNPIGPTKNIDGSTLVTLPHTNCTNSSCIPAIYTGGEADLNALTTLRAGPFKLDD
jgi:hypothetical protein